MVSSSPHKPPPLTMTGIKEWIPILLIIVSLVSGWVLMGAQIRQTQIDVGRLRLEYDVHIIAVGEVREERSAQYTLIQVELAKLNTTLAYIQKEIEALEKVDK